jgi:hypothetical protein
MTIDKEIILKDIKNPVNYFEEVKEKNQEISSLAYLKETKIISKNT